MKPLIFILLLFSAPAFAAVPLLPDLVVREDDLRDLEVDTQTLEGRTLLRLTNAIGNLGFGPLHIRGGAEIQGHQEVYQRIFYNDGSIRERRAGFFGFHAQHNHVHFSDFAVFRLRRVLANGGVGELVTEGHKISFCLTDVDRYVPTAVEPKLFPKHFSGCGNERQGISVGWADVYKKSMPDQWIDITGLRFGEYWLESEVDPSDRLLETDETNNIGRIRIMITPRP